MINAFRENINRGTRVITPANNGVIVPPMEEIKMPVFINCDGNLVPNPAPPFHEYTFTLISECDPNNSEPGPYAFKLFRDREKAEIELSLRSDRTKEVFKIYWDKNNAPHFQKWKGADNFESPEFWLNQDNISNHYALTDKKLIEEKRIDGGKLELPATHIDFTPTSGTPKKTCLESKSATPPNSVTAR